MNSKYLERIKTIDDAGKSSLLRKIHERIQNDMKPNFLDHWNPSEADYRNHMYKILQSLRGTVFPKIGVIKGYPKVFNSGHNSVVFLVTNNDGKKYVIKSKNDNDKECLEIEGEALRRRSGEGVNTPNIVGDGFFNIGDDENYPYIILEYIKQDYEYSLETSEELFEGIGSSLAKMHNVHGEGFGEIVKNENRFIGKSNVYPYPEISNSLIRDYLIENSGLTRDEFNSLVDRSYKKICSDFNQGTQQVWLHRDMGVANALGTRPEITVIDPKLSIGHPMEDIANILLRFSGHQGASLLDKERVKDKMLRNYELTIGRSLDWTLIDACMVVVATFEADTKGLMGGELWIDFLNNIAKNLKRIHDTYLNQSDNNLLTNVMIGHQREEAQFILDHNPDLFLEVVNINRGYVAPLNMDILLRSIKKTSCEESGNECQECDGGSCLTTERIQKIIESNRESIIRNIIKGTYNSFSLPGRAYIFQDAVDEVFDSSDQLLFFEIGASAGYIGQVLTNSNYYKKSGLMKGKKSLDNRETKYYGIDFKLVTNGESIRTLVGRSKVANDFRNEIKQFEDISLIDKGNKIMEQGTLNEEGYDIILSNLMKLRSQFKGTDVKLVIITSTMKYYFTSPEVLDNFELIITKLLEDYYKGTGSDAYYFSRELYGSNGDIYPSKSEVVNEFVFQGSKFNKNGLNNIDDVYFSKKLA